MKAARRKIEAHLFNEKDPVEEYMVQQFELTAVRNDWYMAEKTSDLLCALAGPTRSILLEWDDSTLVSFTDIKDALLKCFGRNDLVQCHEKVLEDLHCGKGQTLQDVAHDIK